MMSNTISPILNKRLVIKRSTKQEIFETVITHLLRQGKQSSILEGARSICMYRKGSLKCAVGVLIKRNEYKADMEFHDVFELAEGNRLPVGLGTEENLNLMSRLQLLHDKGMECNGIDEKWLPWVEEIAEEFSLDTKFLLDEADMLHLYTTRRLEYNDRIEAERLAAELG
jgi:hypothetical protein